MPGIEPEFAETGKPINTLVGRIMEATSPAVIGAQENGLMSFGAGKSGSPNRPMRACYKRSMLEVGLRGLTETYPKRRGSNR